jgi:hypothetical protein
MHPNIFLQAALNGDRIHPAAPRTPTAIAQAARAAVDAGAQSGPIMRILLKPAICEMRDAGLK